MENIENTKEEKIWGTYNTFKDASILDTLDEIDIWKKIDNLGGTIFWQNHDYDKPWATLTSKEMIEAQYNLEYLVYLTRKFGVEFDKEPTATEHVQESKSYNAWFQFWYNHFESMSEEVYKQFVDDKFSGKDISKYMPTTSWKDTLEKVPQKTLK